MTCSPSHISTQFDNIWYRVLISFGDCTESTIQASTIHIAITTQINQSDYSVSSLRLVIKHISTYHSHSNNAIRQSKGCLKCSSCQFKCIKHAVPISPLTRKSGIYCQIITFAVLGIDVEVFKLDRSQFNFDLAS